MRVSDLEQKTHGIFGDFGQFFFSGSDLKKAHNNNFLSKGVAWCRDLRVNEVSCFFCFA